jgi:predicted nucleotidyltransferase
VIIPLIEQKRAEIEALCRKYHVRTLEVFGSAARGGFDTERSDLDFLVEYEDDGPPGGLFQGHFGFQLDLEALFGRAVDLVEPAAIRNSYFLRSVNQHRQVVYESGRAQVPV